MKTATRPTAARSTPHRGAGDEVARKQIRGSSLLLSGRSLSLGAKFAAQVLVVRYLSTSDYGAWAYALSAITFLGAFATLSLDRAVSRFASIYHQREEYDKFFGTLLLVTGAIAITGVAFVVALYLFPTQLAHLTGGDEQPLTLLFIMIYLVPLDALNQLFVALFAIFGRPRAIFFRKYLLGPALQLGIVVLLVLQGAGVAFLAYGSLVGALVGLLINVPLLISILREEDLLSHLRLRNVTVPVREIFAFTVPLMSSDWLAALIQSSGALLLGYFYATEDVGAFRVVVPLAVLNLLVIESFTFLYIPGASRMFAEKDFTGISDLYWRTATWIAVLSFPIFAITFVAATPLTVLVFGARYEESGIVLAVLALGNYFQASLGFNGMTLKVLGKVRYMVVINILSAVINVGLTLLLIPRFGILGAAIAMTGSLIVHNLLKQAGLRITAGFHLMDPHYAAPFVVIAGGVAGLVLFRLLAIDNLFISGAVAAAASLTVLLLTRDALQIGSVFPELKKIPVLRGLFA